MRGLIVVSNGGDSRTVISVLTVILGRARPVRYYPLDLYPGGPTLLATINLLPINGPALGVAVMVSAYWWRVVRMAAKMRRKTGRAANFIPTEPLGKMLRILWQPVVGLWIALPWYAAFRAGPTALLVPLTTSIPMRWTGLVVAVIAYIATRVCWKKMGKSWRMGIDPGEKTSLVVTGPYAFVRHPIYGLSTLLMAATVAATLTPAMIAVAVLHWLLLQWEARREERHLVGVHGGLYEDYRVRTGRFLPRWGRRFDSQTSSPAGAVATTNETTR